MSSTDAAGPDQGTDPGDDVRPITAEQFEEALGDLTATGVASACVDPDAGAFFNAMLASIEASLSMVLFVGNLGNTEYASGLVDQFAARVKENLARVAADPEASAQFGNMVNSLRGTADAGADHG